MAKAKVRKPNCDLFSMHLSTLEKYFGVVEEVDRIELRRYCHLAGKIAELQLAVENLEVVPDKTGMWVPNPRIKVIKDYEALSTIIARKLGLHLSDRIAIERANKEQEIREERLKLAKKMAELGGKAKHDFGAGDDELEPEMDEIACP